MPKTTYIATAPNGQTFKRTTESRTYTHCVAVQHNYFDDLRNAARPANKTDRSNYNWSLDKIVRGVGAPTWVDGKFPDSLITERDVENAKASIGNYGSFEAYWEVQTAKKIARVEQQMADGYYEVWHALCWNGRPDLAVKESSKAAASGRWAHVAILKAEILA